MDFQTSEERRLLAETLSRYLHDKYPIQHRNAVAYDAPFHDPDRWVELIELGLSFALVPEHLGGYGGTGFDVTTVFETLGKALCPEPFLGTVMAARVLAESGDLSDLLAGVRYAVTFDTADGAQVTATETPDGWRLTGKNSVVYGGGSAENILAFAMVGNILGAFQLGAFQLGTDAAEILQFGMIDGGNAATVVFDDTPAQLVAMDASFLRRDALDFGALALCAEAIGAIDASAAMLLEYFKSRQQFGRPIGSFQVLQHRMVDILTELEQARSITILAASRIGTADQSRSVSMAKSLVGRTAQMVAEELIQMHGGIAMTWEYPASHYAKRLVMIDHQLGDSDAHLNRVADFYRGGAQCHGG